MLLSLAEIHEDDEGVTLVEILVVVAILTLIGGFVTTAFVGGFRTTTKAESRIAALDDLQRVAERAGRELRAACWIDDGEPADGDGVQVRTKRDGSYYRFTYWVPAASDTLMQRQEIWDPGGGAWVQQRQGEFIADLTGAGDIFTYHGDADDDGVPEVLVVPLPDEKTRRSVTTIDIAVEQTLPNGQNPIRVETTVHLRNDLQFMDTTGTEPCEADLPS